MYEYTGVLDYDQLGISARPK